MNNPLRAVRLPSGHVLTTWDDNSRTSTGQAQLRYTILVPLPGGDCPACDGTLARHGRPVRGGASCPNGPDPVAEVLFCGADYGVAPSHPIDSDAALLGLLGFLSLRPGDTDSDYFAEYTPAQLAWAQSSACESLSCDVTTAEEAGGCACELWTNLDDWECDDASTVADFKVLDHGEDGSQYFPGCGAAEFERVATGVGDTSADALENALEDMAADETRVSKIQEAAMRQFLADPDKSAWDSLDHSKCGEDHDGDDWNHYVSIRYNLRPAKEG